MTTQFQVGKTYFARSICDHECVYKYAILARTAKTVTIHYNGRDVRRSVKVWDGVEEFKPHGTYSMSATIRASKELVA